MRIRNRPSFCYIFYCRFRVCVVVVFVLLCVCIACKSSGGAAPGAPTTLQPKNVHVVLNARWRTTSLLTESRYVDDRVRISATAVCLSAVLFVCVCT